MRKRNRKREVINKPKRKKRKRKIRRRKKFKKDQMTRRKRKVRRDSFSMMFTHKLRKIKYLDVWVLGKLHLSINFQITNMLDIQPISYKNTKFLVLKNNNLK